MSFIKIVQNSLKVSRVASIVLGKNNNKQVRILSSGIPALNKKTVEITFVKHNGQRVTTSGKVGDSLLDVIVNNHIEIEGYGCCEGTLTCSTCHVVLKQQDFDRLPDRPTGEESDMLELANEVTDTSRLGCQVFLTEDMNGVEIKVPESVDLREQY